jgi:phosphoglycerate dehydrogenase-like enzyme
MPSVVVVTQEEFEKARQTFETAASTGIRCTPAPADEKALADAIHRECASHAIVGVARYSSALYEALPRGGVLARFGVGHEGIDKKVATEHGILCTITPGVLDNSVAELTACLLLSAARRMVTLARECHDRIWQPRLGNELKDHTLAIVGCGAIGRCVGRIAGVGLEMRVLGCDVVDLDVAALQRAYGFSKVVQDFNEVVSEADFVSLHMPGTPETRHFLNAERLSCIRPNAWLINTARGSLVDEVALYEALTSGQLGGAALDVFENEPYQPVQTGKDLRLLDNVIMTPHVGSSTEEACQRMAARALRNVELAESGRYAEMDLLNPGVCERLE